MKTLLLFAIFCATMQSCSHLYALRVHLAPETDTEQWRDAHNKDSW